MPCRPSGDVAATATQARRLAASLGYPVMLKIVSPDIESIAEAGGVLEGMGCAAEVARGFDTVVVNAYRWRPEARVVGVQVLAMR